jgi:hypothetical protein
LNNIRWSSEKQHFYTYTVTPSSYQEIERIKSPQVTIYKICSAIIMIWSYLSNFKLYIYRIMLYSLSYCIEFKASTEWALKQFRTEECVKDFRRCYQLLYCLEMHYCNKKYASLTVFEIWLLRWVRHQYRALCWFKCLSGPAPASKRV